MSAERYLTIEEAALELATLTFDRDSLLTYISSIGIPETSYENMVKKAIKTSQDNFCNQIMSAARHGALTVRNPTSKLPYIPETRRDFYEVISVTDINAWLVKSGIDYKLNKLVVADRNTPESIQSEKQEASWKVKARERADIIYKEQKELGRDPCKSVLADMIAKQFIDDDIRTEKGKRLSSEYITRHALNNWKRPIT